MWWTSILSVLDSNGYQKRNPPNIRVVYAHYEYSQKPWHSLSPTDKDVEVELEDVVVELNSIEDVVVEVDLDVVVDVDVELNSDEIAVVEVDLVVVVDVEVELKLIEDVVVEVELVVVVDVAVVEVCACLLLLFKSFFKAWEFWIKSR